MRKQCVRRRPALSEAQRLYEQVAEASREIERMLDETPHATLCYPATCDDLKVVLSHLQAAYIPFAKAMKREVKYFERAGCGDEIPKTERQTDAFLPWHVASLNQLAESVGIAVSSKIDVLEEQPEKRIVCVWTGSQQQFRATGLLAPGYRFPFEYGHLTLPSGRPRVWPSLAEGYVTITGDEVCYVIDAGPIPLSMEFTDGVQKVEYPKAVLWYGSCDLMIATGVCKKNQVPVSMKQPVRRSQGSDTPSWVTKRYPDGTIVYRLERESVWHERVARFERSMAEYCQRNAVPHVFPADPARSTERPRDYLSLAWTNPSMGGTKDGK